jgi:hypothetical protein
MPWMIWVVLMLIGLGVAGFAVRARAQEDKGGVVTVERVTRASNAEIEQMIDKLEARPAPEAKMGAMCYDMVMPSPVTEYVCPVCGEKTLYPLEEGHWRTPLNELERLRKNEREAQMAAEKLGAVIFLDEKQFCRHCQPDFEGEPHAALVTRLPNGREKRTEGFTVRDLWILRDFFSGKDVVVGSQDDEEPLKDQLPRLRELMLVLPE